MGVTYFLLPVGYRSSDDPPSAPSWVDRTLERFGMTPPPASRPGRYPSPREARAVLDSFTGYTTSYEVTQDWWNAWIQSVTDEYDRTCLSFGKWSGDEDSPSLCYFDKGNTDLIVKVTERLTHFCGPLVIDTDAPGIPVIVTPGMTAAEARKQQEAIEAQVMNDLLAELVTSTKAPADTLKCPICLYKLHIFKSSAEPDSGAWTVEVECETGHSACISYEGKPPLDQGIQPVIHNILVTDLPAIAAEARERQGASHSIKSSTDTPL